MKVIKVGTNNQTRIAQACDRCRSKKIRCDGVRPQCTQCVNVGFECKTSDKLSRRAFPRGYTESLEERVRALEAEVRDLKDLLDEKDEKIDMLSRIHSHSSPTHSAPRRSSTPISEAREELQEKDDTFKIQQAPLLLDDENRDTYCVGSSSGRAFVGTFARIRGSDATNTSRIVQAARARVWPVLCRRKLKRLLWHWIEALGTAFTEASQHLQSSAASGV